MAQPLARPPGPPPVARGLRRRQGARLREPDRVGLGRGERRRPRRARAGAAPRPRASCSCASTGEPLPGEGAFFAGGAGAAAPRRPRGGALHARGRARAGRAPGGRPAGRRRRRAAPGRPGRGDRARPCAASAASSTCSSTVATIDGVAYFNDSKATNVDAARRSVEAFDRPRAARSWAAATRAATSPTSRRRSPRAAGGCSRSARRASASPEALGGAVPVERCDSLAAAVARARALARPGDVVLLAPACSSFDMFRDYAERGRAFKAAVRALAPSRAPSRAPPPEGPVAKKLSPDLTLLAVTVAADGLRHGDGLERLVRAGPGPPRQPLLLPDQAGAVGRDRHRRDGGGAAPRLPDRCAAPRSSTRCSSSSTLLLIRCCSCTPVNETPPLDPPGRALVPARRAGEALDRRLPRLPHRAARRARQRASACCFPGLLLLGWFGFLVLIQPDLGTGLLPRAHRRRDAVRGRRAPALLRRARDPGARRRSTPRSSPCPGASERMLRLPRTPGPTRRARATR